MKRTLTSIATVLEDLVEWALPDRADGTPGIEPYLGYSTPDAIVLRGRVLALRDADDPVRSGSKWDNFQGMAAMFDTREMAGVKVACRGVDTLSDEEGYFTLTLPRTGEEGWVERRVTLPEHSIETVCRAKITRADAEFGVISDIDDTMILTEAWSLRRNLWNSMTGTSASRHVFPDAVALMDRLHADKNPVFYVSSSPWNLHAFLEEMFARNGLVQGPKFLRDLGLGPGQLITPTTGHHGHKGGSLDLILAANPGLPFTLIGDTGQHDAQVYLEAVRRHGIASDGGRIAHVILRVAEPVLGKDDNRALTELQATGVRVERVEDYSQLDILKA